jgi:hypothetical protein
MCKVKGGKPMVTVGTFGIPFHKDCFKCEDCSTLLDPKGQFQVKGNRLFAPSCFEKFIVKS